MASRWIGALVTALLMTATPSGADAADPAVGLSGLRANGTGTVTVVADVSPAPASPLTADDLTVTSEGAVITATTAPLISGRSSLSLVVDASAQSAESRAGGALSGVATFLLQAPPDATLSMVADQAPPVLIAPPVVGVSSVLTAASNLRGSGARATPDALSLALKQLRPGSPGVVVLYTAADDAGGPDAESLAARVQAAGAVLAVVTTSGDDGYWTKVAESTGGMAISTRPADAIAAFDRLSDGLRSRMVVTFPHRPAEAAVVTVSVRTSSGIASAATVVPAGQGTTRAQDPPASSGGNAGWIAGLVAAAVLLIAIVAFWSRRRSRGSRSARTVPNPPESPFAPPPGRSSPGDPGRLIGLPGVRVFDVERSGTPTEITGSLFEPRSVRDAREAMPPAGQHEDAEPDQQSR